ncbi:MAG: glycosyltransferase family 9 protein, partial [Sedimentisphaerales bacterium]|nr:glycosyltransferase family 9 protein [Sedimentisphaerales bacterium]
MKHAKEKILVVLPTPMGDVILSTPALRRLRDTLNDAHITFSGNPRARAILDASPWADDWITLENDPPGFSSTAGVLRRQNFKSAILMTNSLRSALLTWRAGIPQRIGYRRDGRGLLLTSALSPFRLVHRFAPISMIEYYNFLMEKAIIHIKKNDSSPGSEKINFDHHLELFTREDNQAEADTLYQHWGLSEDEQVIILVPGGAYGPSKYWATDRFASLADRLTQDGYTIILSCAPTPAEQDIARQIIEKTQTPVFDTSRQELSLGGLKELIRRARLMVANDTGP